MKNLYSYFERLWNLYVLRRSVHELEFIANKCLEVGLSKQSRALRQIAQDLNVHWESAYTVSSLKKVSRAW